LADVPSNVLDKTLYSTRKKSRELNITFQRFSRHLKIEMVFPNYLKSSSQSWVKFCYRLIRCAFTNYLRYTIKLIMADVGQIGVSGEQSQRCLVLIQIWFNVIIKQLMTFNFGEYKDAEVNIMFHGLINPCIHLIESHRLYSVHYTYKNEDIKLSTCMHNTFLGWDMWTL
jgi:hypothetical protein